VAVELKLEPVSEENEYATVLRWHAREGESVTAGDVVVEVEAEKANVEIVAPTDGVVRAILAAEGDEVRVGATLAVIDEPGGAATAA
jgi:2-oxoglutarate dehydrogenase E2 component (dihydrolipoamide succinyltransferase)